MCSNIMASAQVILIKGGCKSGRKVVTHNSKSDFPLVVLIGCFTEGRVDGRHAFGEL